MAGETENYQALAGSQQQIKATSKIKRKLDKHRRHPIELIVDCVRLKRISHPSPKNYQLFIATIISISVLVCKIQATDLQTDANFHNDAASSNEVDPCEACRLVVKSFELGMEETSRGKHEGGDTSWEEKNLKSYSDSEVRLVEIQERICEDVKSKGKAQCLSLAEDSESLIEDWWSQQKNKNVRLHDYLCISKLKRCCASGRYGPNCQACPSDCNQHGLCDGDGTRSGSGKCVCDPGYSGKDCESCTDDHFRVGATSDHFSCLECDSACNGCFGPGRLNCTECKSGFTKHDTSGCIDINECDIGFDNGNTDNPPRLCKGNTYCLNTEGSYKCKQCHESCDGCVGYGPDLCLSCAIGYSYDSDRVCRDGVDLFRHEQWKREDASGKTAKQESFGRYFFYVGLIGVSVLVFGMGANVYIVYSFMILFTVILVASEFDLLDEMPEYSFTSSE